MMARSCYVLAVLVSVVVPIGLGALPGGLGWNAWLVLHLLGWGAPLREHAGTPEGGELLQPLADGVVEEVDGLPDPALFRVKYMSERPVVFRRAATQENGWRLEVFGSGASAALKESFGNGNVAAYTDQMDVNTYQSLSLADYQLLEASARSDSSRPKPFLHVDITNHSALAGAVPVHRLVGNYHSTSMLPSLQLYYGPAGTATRMHMDVADGLIVQVHGHTRWVSVERQYAQLLKVHADEMNMGFFTSPDMRSAPMPAGVPVREAFLSPGDVLYCPPMTFHGGYTLGNEPSLVIESLTIDPAVALRRHWLLSLATLLNPVTTYRSIEGWVNNPGFTSADLYLGARQRAREAGATAGVESRGRSFFGAYFVALLLSVGVNRLHGTKPLVFLTAARTYQAFGHLLYAFGHGNDFTRFSATEGWGLLCDSTDFLAEGIVFRNKALLSWGCIHFSHWIAQQLAFPQTCLALVHQQGFAFWSTLMLDNLFNIYAMVYVFQQLLLCNSSGADYQPKVRGRNSEPPLLAAGHPEPDAHGEPTDEVLQQAHRGVLALFAAIVVWTLLNESSP